MIRHVLRKAVLDSLSFRVQQSRYPQRLSNVAGVALDCLHTLAWRALPMVQLSHAGIHARCKLLTPSKVSSRAGCSFFTHVTQLIMSCFHSHCSTFNDVMRDHSSFLPPLLMEARSTKDITLIRTAFDVEDDLNTTVLMKDDSIFVISFHSPPTLHLLGNADEIPWAIRSVVANEHDPA
jgi:hypothetical protein